MDALCVDTTPPPGGALDTPPSIGFTQRVPEPPPLDLDDDTPLACALRPAGEDGPCEACQ